jgi:hypothetical protein
MIFSDSGTIKGGVIIILLLYIAEMIWYKYNISWT